MPRGQRRQPVHEEETERVILRTAHHLFMEHGYRAVSTRQIAEACGLTQPALYHYFADKQDLYVAVMQHDIEQTKAALERIAHRSEGIEERLKRIVRYLLSTTQHDLGLMLHDIRKELTPEAQAILDEEFRAGIVAPIASVFEEGIQQGVLCTPQQGGLDAHTATYLFMTMLSKFLPKSLEAQHPGTIRRDSTIEGEYAELVVHILLHGLACTNKEQEGTAGSR